MSQQKLQISNYNPAFTYRHLWGQLRGLQLQSDSAGTVEFLLFRLQNGATAADRLPKNEQSNAEDHLAEHAQPAEQSEAQSDQADAKQRPGEHRSGRQVQDLWEGRRLRTVRHHEIAFSRVDGVHVLVSWSGRGLGRWSLLESLALYMEPQAFVNPLSPY